MIFDDLGLEFRVCAYNSMFRTRCTTIAAGTRLLLCSIRLQYKTQIVGRGLDCVFCVVYSQSFRTESCKMVLLKIGETDTRDIAVCLLHRGKLPLLAADPTESRRSLCCGSPLLWDDRKINNHQHSATFCNIATCLLKLELMHP